LQFINKVKRVLSYINHIHDQQNIQQSCMKKVLLYDLKY